MKMFKRQDADTGFYGNRFISVQVQNMLSGTKILVLTSELEIQLFVKFRKKKKKKKLNCN